MYLLAMSCQLNLLTPFRDIKNVRKYLFPNQTVEETAEIDSESWDNADWGWNDEDADKKGATEKSAGACASEEEVLPWLQDCHISISPTGDFLALGHSDRMVILSQKWSSKGEDTASQYTAVFEGVVSQDQGEEITCTACLPLASQQRSMQGGPDWTCILVGFSSGYVRMYTENGTLLLSQIFSDQPVTKIKCRTYELPRHPADAEKHEELTILYKRCLVTIDGFSFYQSLRACKNQVARATASGSELIQPPPLAYKKWSLSDQDRLSEHVPCGMVSPNPFDQMQTAAMIGGHGASIKCTPPASQIYLVTGLGPYIAFFHAVEGSAQPMLSDVAHAVASKLKSALFSHISAASGWLGFSGKQAHVDPNKERKKPKIEPATSLGARFGLFDKRRQGEGIILSPDNKMAATTDSFGRVMLIDVLRGVAVRMWKGNTATVVRL